MENLIGWLFVLLLIIALAFVLRRVLGMHRRGLAMGQESLENVQRTIAIAEENLALNRRRVEQGDEMIALLQALNDNLANRTLKN